MDPTSKPESPSGATRFVLVLTGGQDSSGVSGSDSFSNVADIHPSAYERMRHCRRPGAESGPRPKARGDAGIALVFGGVNYMEGCWPSTCGVPVAAPPAGLRGYALGTTGS